MKNTNILSELYKGLIGVKSWLRSGTDVGMVFTGNLTRRMESHLQ